MNRFALIAATGFLALMLTACGDNGSSKPAEDTTTTGTVVEQPKADDAAAKTDATTTDATTTDADKAAGSEEQKATEESH
ncbi:hypothetical protein [Legionella shakespearei]|uniref:Lipoprotein n=1 Tax=Legionella shakespearei DSM 23087 TaxID=1122169 RepID=A0A0W0Z7G4_9GAMM|nr:hypothetical protein [Legionella shakespearei]KTD65048.1 hypothetical protein Lsha_0417 [Legionella shakespearei DSM 23087]